MKKHYFLSVFLFLMINGLVMGQKLVDTLNTWNVEHCCSPTSTRAYMFEGDTVINSVSYNKLYYSYSEFFDNSKKTYAGALRQDGQKVYIAKSDTGEALLYDFSLEKNDTFNYTNTEGYNISMVVDSVDSVMINGDLHKRLIFQDIGSNNYKSQTWIEGIGSSYGLIEVFSPHIADMESDLLCVKNGSKLLYQQQGTTSCYISTASLKNIHSENNIRIVPGPSPLEIKIEFPNGIDKDFLIQVFDLQGRLIFAQQYNSGYKTICRVPYPGIFIVKILETNVQNFRSFKVMVK